MGGDKQRAAKSSNNFQLENAMLVPSLELIEKIIRINSVTHYGNEEIIRFLIPLIEDLGLNIQEQKVIENGQAQFNLVASSHSPHAPNLFLFNSHLDTVSSGEAKNWTKTNGDPFQATKIRDRIYGLGTADVKLDFLCKLWAAKQSRPWNRPIAIVGTFGEERGLVGVNHLLKSKKVKPKFAMVGEPSNLELVYAHKGNLTCVVSVPKAKPTGLKIKTKSWRGKAAHSSTPQIGTNAISRALTDIFKRGLGILELSGGTDSNKVPELCSASFEASKNKTTDILFSLVNKMQDFSHELKKWRDTRFSPATCTLCLTQVKTQEREVLLTFNLRSLPEIPLGRLTKRVGECIKASGAKMVEIHSNEPLRGRKNSKLMNMAMTAMKEIGHKPVRTTKASVTEAAVYQHHGAEAIVFGPGISLGNVHRPNEFNSLTQLELATRFYHSLIHNSFEH